MNFLFLHLAARALLRRRTRAAITLGSIALGVAALTFLGSIMVGVNDAMIANSIALHTGNALVRSDDADKLAERWRKLKDLPPQITAVLPRLTAPAMLVTPSNAAAVQLMGVQPDRERAVSAIPARVVSGHYLSQETSDLEILIGAGAARQLAVKPADSLTIRLSNGKDVTASVAGIFRTGIERFDEGVVYTHLSQMEKNASEMAKGEVALFARKGVPSDLLKQAMKPYLAPGETFAPWEQLLPEVDQLTKLNVVSMYIVIIIVVIMLAAGVSNTTLISVMDRYREFGILKALGTTPGEIIRLVLTETALVCLLSGAIGVLLGSGITILANRTGIDLGRFTSENPHFVLSSVVYPRHTWSMAFAPVLTVLVTGLLASLWPALIAARHRAAEVLRLPA